MRSHSLVHFEVRFGSTRVASWLRVLRQVVHKGFERIWCRKREKSSLSESKSEVPAGLQTPAKSKRKQAHKGVESIALSQS